MVFVYQSDIFYLYSRLHLNILNFFFSSFEILHSCVHHFIVSHSTSSLEQRLQIIHKIYPGIEVGLSFVRVCSTRFLDCKVGKKLGFGSSASLASRS